MKRFDEWKIYDGSHYKKEIDAMVSAGLSNSTLSAFKNHRQRTYMFENGWGASVIEGGFCYGHHEGLKELGVFKYDDEGNHALHYDNPVAEGDVRGHLTDAEVVALLYEIKGYPSDGEFFNFNKAWIGFKEWCRKTFIED